MPNQIFLTTALCLPAPDVEALIQGRSIAAISQTFMNPGQVFALCPLRTLVGAYDKLTIEQYYNDRFLPIAQIVSDHAQHSDTTIMAWARSESCRLYQEPHDLEALSKTSIWQQTALQEIIKIRHKIFLVYLRCYRLSEAILMENRFLKSVSSGAFIKLPKSLVSTDATPILTDANFTVQFQRLDNLEPPPHPKLEKLYLSIIKLLPDNPIVISLSQDFNHFLGYASQTLTSTPDPDLAWIQKITEVGNSSDGYSFEKLVRRSFIKLGFNNTRDNGLDPEATGGAAGLDLYCDLPYSVVGECKATKHKKVPNSVTAQLIHLGVTHLRQQEFDQSIKIIFAAGKLTKDANKAAKGSRMNIIRPETLQRLVELKAQFPGSIDLMDLKLALEKSPFGEDSDAKINQYIDNVIKSLKLRQKIVQEVRAYQETLNKEPDANVLYSANLHQYAQGLSITLNEIEFKNYLIELASPLTGYLGRRKGEDGRDRFYFLRELEVSNL